MNKLSNIRLIYNRFQWQPAVSTQRDINKEKQICIIPAALHVLHLVWLCWSAVISWAIERNILQKHELAEHKKERQVSMIETDKRKGSYTDLNVTTTFITAGTSCTWV